VGDAAAGERYFARACSRCHTPDGDLRGIASRIADARELQNRWVAGGGAGRGGGRGGGREGADADNPRNRVTVTVTAPGRPPVSGRLVRIDVFVVWLVQDDGARRTFHREGATPRVEISDPLEPHRRLVLELADTDMHNVTAYLATLK